MERHKLYSFFGIDRRIIQMGSGAFSYQFRPTRKINFFNNWSLSHTMFNSFEEVEQYLLQEKLKHERYEANQRIVKIF